VQSNARVATSRIPADRGRRLRPGVVIHHEVSEDVRKSIDLWTG
jgi:hypothetical protein